MAASKYYHGLHKSWEHQGVLQNDKKKSTNFFGSKVFVQTIIVILCWLKKKREVNRKSCKLNNDVVVLEGGTPHREDEENWWRLGKKLLCFIECR